MTTPLSSNLGQLAAPPAQRPFDAIRLQMIDQLIAARQHDAGHAPWSRAWEAAAAAVRDEVLADARASLQAARLHSHYPARRLTVLEPDSEAAEILHNRILAEGIDLERFEGQPAGAEADRRRAAALETAWLGATRLAAGEAARWRAAAAKVAEWRRPMKLFWVMAALGLATTALVAGWLGGQFPAPEWFRPVHDAWWSLPWP